MKTIFVFVAIIAFTIGHDTMTVPAPRETVESTVKYCGQSSSIDPTTPSANVESGKNITVEWKKSHTGGSVLLYLVPLTKNPSLDQINAGKLGTFVYNSKTISVKIPESFNPGVYTLAWNWETYWSCADIRVTYKVPEGAILEYGTSYTLSSKSGTFDAATGICSCFKGFKQTTKSGICDCKKSSSGAAVGVTIFILALIGVGVAVGLFVFKKKNPATFAVLKDKAVGGMKGLISKIRH